MNNCKTCQFYNYYSLREEAKGVCRRYPPTIMRMAFGNSSVWPEVSDLDTCGEHRTENAE